MGPPTWLTATLLALLFPVTAYGIVIVAHARSLFPDDLVGRGVTTVNLARVIGTTLLPVTAGRIVDAFAALCGHAPEIAYRDVIYNHARNSPEPRGLRTP